MHLDLHRHLEGSHSPAALAKVAREFNLRSPLLFDDATQRFRDEQSIAAQVTLTEPSDDSSRFYRCIVQARQAYVSVEAIAALSVLAFREAAEDTDGFELRLSLFSMVRTLLEHQRLAWRDVPPVVFAERWAQPILLAVLAARDQVAKETGTPMVVRLGLSRTFESEPHYRALADMVVEHAPRLVGLDVLGIVPPPDAEPMPEGLVAVLERLRPHLPDLTIHAGEFSGRRARARKPGHPRAPGESGHHPRGVPIEQPPLDSHGRGPAGEGPRQRAVARAAARARALRAGQ